MNAYDISELRAAGRVQRFSARANSVVEAKAMHWRTAFLCHSHKDREAALGLKAIIEEQGGSLYIDWLDEGMPESPNRETAERIRKKIVECDFFLFLATANSTASRWCPWEIGYADGKKPSDAIVIVPTTDQGRFYGNEYLQLYRRLDPSTLLSTGRRATPPTVIRPGEYSGVLVRQL